MKRILTIKILTVVTLATGVFAQSSQPQTQPATSNTIRAGALTPEQIRQVAKEKQQKAEDERLARQIEHAKKQVEAAQAELDAITDSGYDSSIKRKYVIRDGRRYYRAVDGPNGRGADMKVAQETLAVVKTKLAELEAKAKERGLTTSTSLSTAMLRTGSDDASGNCIFSLGTNHAASNGAGGGHNLAGHRRGDEQ